MASGASHGHRERALEDVVVGRMRLRGVSRNVGLMGIVSFAADVSSEVAYPLIPLFLTVTLGASVPLLGLIEGIAEGTASLLKVASGWLSDRVGRRKPLVVAGYGLSALGKLLLPLSFFWPQVLLARFVDRFGKGVRTSPRDAMIAESTAPGLSGSAFGFHRAMDTAGAVAGPLIALGLLTASDERLRLVLAFAVIPGALSILPFAFVRELAPVRDGRARAASPPKGAVPREFWLMLGIALLFGLVNSSDVFIILRASGMGMGFSTVVLAYVLYNTIYSLLAYPLGDLSDRVGKRPLLAGGFAVFGLVYLGLALLDSKDGIWPLFAIYGVYVAATDGVARSYVSDLAPARERATLIGLYHTLVGLAAVIASATAGILWDVMSPRAPFALGAAGGLGCALLVLLLLPARPRRPAPTS